MSQNPLVGLILFMVMGLFTLWFTSLMLKVIDLLYKPSVKKWIKNSGGQKVINIHADGFCSFDINNMDQDQDCLDEKIAKVLPDIAKLSVLPKETPAYKKESKTLKGFTVIPSSDKNTKPITKTITKKNKKNVSSKTTVSNNITFCCMNLTLEEFLLSLCNFTEFSCYC